uniref:Uncharacterized protein n=1 Tax=Plectus sambesii TaxID=2011161 RepID=A0A914UP51_9BILA
MRAVEGATEVECEKKTSDEVAGRLTKSNGWMCPRRLPTSTGLYFAGRRTAESGSFSEFRLISEHPPAGVMSQHDKRPPYSSNPYPPVYNGTTTTTAQLNEVEPIDCNPRYCYTPFAFVRHFELVRSTLLS